VGPANVMTKLFVVPLIKKQKISYQHAVFLLEIGFIYIFNGNLKNSLCLWLCMILIYGLVFGKMVLCPHRQIQLWSEGATEIKDYVIHTIATTCDTNH
jgi:hypothetical protein